MWGYAHDAWQARWDAVFDPAEHVFSGSLPILDLEESESEGSENVTRVYYVSVLSVLSLLRTNLPLVYAISYDITLTARITASALPLPVACVVALTIVLSSPVLFDQVQTRVHDVSRKYGASGRLEPCSHRRSGPMVSS